ncbi:Uncharacterised protein [Candidatus Bilamarchaeum dharawalense]|uniref:Uncharacterized protein n=1 Tax=Candidatus Bilamarchaeum dharawalense TaxID=2885759 RepID=A0A5E4LTE1_9ARCH|nr:Uncharacterised protein [Candidatus Bilamarchaeum dharawalense]
MPFGIALCGKMTLEPKSVENEKEFVKIISESANKSKSKNFVLMIDAGLTGNNFVTLYEASESKFPTKINGMEHIPEHLQDREFVKGTLMEFLVVEKKSLGKMISALVGFNVEPQFELGQLEDNDKPNEYGQITEETLIIALTKKGLFFLQKLTVEKIDYVKNVYRKNKLK